MVNIILIYASMMGNKEEMAEEKAEGIHQEDDEMINVIGIGGKYF